MNIWYLVGVTEFVVALLKGFIYSQTGSNIDLGLAVTGLILSGLFFVIARNSKKK